MRGVISWTLIICLLAACQGCAKSTLPEYVRDENPYKKIFYSSYELSLQAVSRTLAELGWKIVSSNDPQIYERGKTIDENIAQQVLLFARKENGGWPNVSQPPRLNIYIRTNKDNRTEIEIRYLNILNLGIKRVYDYRNDRIVEEIFKKFERQL